MGLMTARAADMPVRPVYKAPPPVVPVWSWTGCYIGANAGGAWQKVDNALIAANGTPAYFGVTVLPEVSRNGTGDLEGSGFIGGAQVGCNYQSGRVVWGVETDFNWMSQDDHFGGRFVYSTDPCRRTSWTSPIRRSGSGPCAGASVSPPLIACFFM